MDTKVIREFLNMQLDAVEGVDNETETGLSLILMADYLLEAAENREEIFTKADEQKLRKIFLRVGSLEERIKNIYTEHHTPLAESAARLLQRIEENGIRIQEKQQEIAKYDTSVRELEETIETEKDLLAQEAELREREKHLRTVIDKITECEKIQKEIPPELLAGKEIELSGLKKETEDLKKQNEELDKEISSVKVTLKEQKEQKEDLETQKKTLENQITEVTANITHLQGELLKLDEDNATYEQKAEALSEAIIKASATFDELKAELEENERIEAGIREVDFFDPEDFKAHLKEMKEQGNRLLAEYERMLQDILEDAKTLYKKIKERHHL